MTRGRIASRTRAPGPPIPSSSSSHSSPDALERTLERKPSQSYAHNRNTSIVHGVQHSRNTSYVNSPATSPLSEHAQVITGLDGAIMSQDSITAAFSAHGLQPRAIIEPAGVVGTVDAAALMSVESTNLVFVRPGGAADGRLPR